MRSPLLGAGRRRRFGVVDVTKWESLVPFLRRGKWNAVKVNDAILESSLSHSEKLAALAIVSHRSDQHPKPSPGIRRLSALTSQKPDTVVAAVNQLERRGLLKVGRRNRQANSYDVAPLMSGLLTVPPIRTASVPKEGTDPVAAIGTGRAVSPPETCPDPGVTAVPIGGLTCPKRGNASDQRSDQLKQPDPSARRASASRPAVRKAKPERTPEQREQYGRLVDAYFRAYEACTGNKPPFGSREGKAVWALLDAVGPEKAAAAIANAFADEWGRRRSIRSVADDPAKFLGGAVGNGRPKRWVQSGGYDASAAIVAGKLLTGEA